MGNHGDPNESAFFDIVKHELGLRRMAVVHIVADHPFVEKMISLALNNPFNDPQIDQNCRLEVTEYIHRDLGYPLDLSTDLTTGIEKYMLEGRKGLRG